MQTVLYDGSWDGFLCAVFDVYEYKFTDAQIVPEHRFNGNLFATVHHARMEQAHSQRVWKGLERILSVEATTALYRAFLSEEAESEDHLLAYIRYAFASGGNMEDDLGHASVLYVVQTARRVWREKHRMEAFVRFQETADGMYCAFIEPDHDVLPIISPHFEARYADQRWMIYDTRRKYGIYYDGSTVAEVDISFEDKIDEHNIAPAHAPNEAAYQALWQQYFKSVNIAARKNTKLHVQHMPRRYWKNLPEKQPTVAPAFTKKK
ncbi:TIGR03915 family putative DNA repair protein [Pseudocnuella soli]|uniref:TIGR03915 family putative DNA repair protein n=1 Tax=Pseudocnuella soli TaxID=2502779 RepID=UPI001049F422|nr:TIGR03915 family putative DNA repair protein [Pseudocnuella soli]